MTKKTHLTISTPEGIFFENDVEIVTIKTLSGFIGLQANCESYLSAIDIGQLTIERSTNRHHKVCAISNGLVYADQTSVKVIAETIDFRENIDLKATLKIQKSAESKLKSNLSKVEQRQVKIELKKALNKIRIKNET